MSEKTFSDIFEIYNRSVPFYNTTYDWFCGMLSPETAHIIYARDGEKVIGFSMIHGTSIALLCVDEGYRGKGTGSDLLRQSEEFIGTSGGKTVYLGRGPHTMLQGVPLENPGAAEFFIKHGYFAEYVTVNMKRMFDGFDIDEIDAKIPPKPDNITFRFAEKGDKEELLKAVAEVDESWVDIFRDADDDFVLIAVSDDGKILGFEAVEPYGAHFAPNEEKPASIGCVGVVKSARVLGIGRRMVVEGMKWLKSEGCTSVELLYIVLIGWYEKMGLKVHGRQFMAEKKLEPWHFYSEKKLSD